MSSHRQNSSSGFGAPWRRWLALLAAVLTVSASAVHAGGAARLLQRYPFQAGVAHVQGRYAFTGGNFLVEGADRLAAMGAPSISIYLTNRYANEYPDKGAGLFGQPHNLTELAASPAYRRVFNMPFKVYLITVFSFSNTHLIMKSPKSNADLAASEQAEMYDLTRYLYRTYRGSNKVFILQNWESDWFTIGAYQPGRLASEPNLERLTVWLKARQRGVSQARAEAGDPDDVAVLNAIEINRPLDTIEGGHTRVIDGVVPFVGADMVTYSSFDATTGRALPQVRPELTKALDGIDHYAPDPLGLGRRRILISQYGYYENRRAGSMFGSPADHDRRVAIILDTARRWGASGAYFWELFDNDCFGTDRKTKAPAVAAQVGDPQRPDADHCEGDWLVRPDGSTSNVVGILRPYWPAHP